MKIIRLIIILSIKRFRAGYFKKLKRRLQHTEIGIFGNVSLWDDGVAKKEKMKPLNFFERWLIGPKDIKKEKKMLQDIFQRIMERDLEKFNFLGICKN